MEYTDELEHGFMINELLRVQLPDDVNSRSYYSRIEDVAEKTLIVTWPTDGGVTLPAHPDQMLSFALVRDGVAYSFNGLVDTIAGEPLPVLKIIITSPIQRIQRRQDFRVKCLIPIEIVATLPKTLTEESPSTLHLRAKTYDLSASGVSLRTMKIIPEEAFPTIKLSLPDGDQPIKTTCQVAHCFVVPENPEMFHIGIRFLDLEEKNRARIARFVYRTQVKRI